VNLKARENRKGVVQTGISLQPRVVGTVSERKVETCEENNGLAQVPPYFVRKYLRITPFLGISKSWPFGQVIRKACNLSIEVGSQRDGELGHEFGLVFQVPGKIFRMVAKMMEII